MQLFSLFLCILFLCTENKRNCSSERWTIRSQSQKSSTWRASLGADSYLEAFLKSLSVENLASSNTTSTIVEFSLHAKWGEMEVSPSCWQRRASHLLHACGCCQDLLFSSRGVKWGVKGFSNTSASRHEAELSDHSLFFTPVKASSGLCCLLVYCGKLRCFLVSGFNGCAWKRASLKQQHPLLTWTFAVGAYPSEPLGRLVWHPHSVMSTFSVSSPSFMGFVGCVKTGTGMKSLLWGCVYSPNFLITSLYWAK